MYFHTVSSTNQLNTCLEMNGIHYLSSTLKVSQLTFKVIVRKKDTAVVGKHFHFQELPHWMSEISHLELTGCCWEQSSITQGQLSGCGSYLSFSLSSLQIRPHTCSHNPKTARLRSSVGSPLTTTQRAGRLTTER